MSFRNLRPIPPLTLLLLAALLLPSCSTFDRDWEAAGLAAGTDARGDAPGVEGRWHGIWVSTANGHSGGLRCLLTTDETGTLHARYHATYGGIFTFEYAMPMTVRREGDSYRFSAEADLGGLAGGLYVYEGTIEGDEFSSTYECARDQGVFRMLRKK